MSRPNSIVISSVEIPVTYKADLTHTADDGHEHGAWGIFRDFDITIAEGQPGERERITLLHEILHAVMEISGLSARLDENEEQVVDDMTIPMLSFLRENPETVRYLWGGE
jgi:Zn-dependent peptidase ImmA (M78 family)